jgi:hypothetical protein
MAFKLIHNQGGVEYVRETYMQDGWVTQEKAKAGDVRLIHGTLYVAHDTSLDERRLFMPGFRKYRTLWVALRAEALPRAPAFKAGPANTVRVNIEAHGVDKMEEQYKRLDVRLASVLEKAARASALRKRNARAWPRKVKP